MKLNSSTISVSMFIWNILSLLLIIGGCSGNRDPMLEEPPFIVTIVTNNNTVYVNQPVTLVAFAKDLDKDDEISYKWKAELLGEYVTKIVFKDGSTGQRVKFTANTEGKYSIELTARDSSSNESNDSLQIEATLPPTKPQIPLLIIEPKDGETVDINIDIKGIYHEIPTGKRIVVYTYNHESRRWTLQPYAIFLTDGHWIVYATLGEQNAKGVEFDIRVRFDVKGVTKAGIIESFIDPQSFYDIISVVSRQ